MTAKPAAATLSQTHLLGIERLTDADIELILATARPYQTRVREEPRPVVRSEKLAGRTMVQTFFESSTRTRGSFEVAGRRLGMDVVNLSMQASSTQKGESLIDTIQTLSAMRPDALVIRHPAHGAPHMLVRHTLAHIINAGDGAHEHPTQALLDALTMLDYKPRLDGLEVAIIGDIMHSRVARSNIHLLSRFGARVRLGGPPPLVPKELERMGPGVTVCEHMKDAIEGADVVMMLRVQLERQNEPLFSSTAEYSRHYSLTLERLRWAKPDALVMHPGPVIRGIEMPGEVLDGPQSVVLQQVENGVAIRMAVLELLVGADE